MLYTELFAQCFLKNLSHRIDRRARPSGVRWWSLPSHGWRRKNWTIWQDSVYQKAKNKNMAKQKIKITTRCGCILFKIISQTQKSISWKVSILKPTVGLQRWRGNEENLLFLQRIRVQFLASIRWLSTHSRPQSQVFQPVCRQNIHMHEITTSCNRTVCALVHVRVHMWSGEKLVHAMVHMWSGEKCLPLSLLI